jgi:hypothetical protein
MTGKNQSLRLWPFPERTGPIASCNYFVIFQFLLNSKPFLMETRRGSQGVSPALELRTRERI